MAKDRCSLISRFRHGHGVPRHCMGWPPLLECSRCGDTGKALLMSGTVSEVWQSVVDGSKGLWKVPIVAL